MKNLRIPIMLVGIFCPTFTAFSQSHWQSISDLNANARFRSASFAVNGKGYVASGSISGQPATTQVWQYDPATDSWNQMASMPKGLRKAVSFSIGSDGYVGTGETLLVNMLHTNDFYKYNASTNSWSQQADVPGAGGFSGIRTGAFGFAIGSKGYLGGGAFFGGIDGVSWFKDFWEYNPSNNTWTRKADVTNPEGGRENAATFVSNGKGYMCNGNIGGFFYKDIWEYNPSSNVWVRKNDHPGIRRTSTTGFSINNVGYLATGESPNGLLSELWQYNQSTDSWTARTNFAGSSRTDAVAFVINNKAYVGTGNDSGGLRKDFYSYDPSCDYDPDIVGPLEFCSGNATYTLLDYPPSTTTITWSKSNNLNYVSGQGSVNYVVTPNANGTAWVEANITSGCSNIGSVRRNITWIGVPGHGPMLYRTNITKTDPPPTDQLCNSGVLNFLEASYTGPGTILEYDWKVPSGWVVSPEGADKKFARVQTGWTSTNGTVEVRARNACGWSGWNSKNFSVITCTSFFSTVFPNPAKDELVVSIAPENTNAQFGAENLIKGEYQIELYNHVGKKEISLKTTQKKVNINTSALPGGLYELKIIHQDGVIDHSVLIEH